jgi:hypothetical protein
MVELRPTHPQRRQASRRAVRLPCEAVRDLGFVRVGERLVDLSSTGAFLESDALLDLGEEVILSFRAPRTRLWMDARGIVVRRIQGKRLGDRARGVGLRFLPLDAADRAVLDATLSKVPPVLPTRRDAIDYASAVLAIGA